RSRPRTATHPHVAGSCRPEIGRYEHPAALRYFGRHPLDLADFSLDDLLTARAVRVRTVRLLLLPFQPERVPVRDRVVARVRVHVDAAIEPDRVLGDEAAGPGVVVAGPHVVQPGLGVEFPAGVAERVGHALARGVRLAEGLVAVLVHQAEVGAVDESEHVAREVGRVVVDGAAALDAVGPVRAGVVGVLGPDGAGAVQLQEQVVAVPDVAGAARTSAGPSRRPAPPGPTTRRAAGGRPAPPALEAPLDAEQLARGGDGRAEDPAHPIREAE